MTRSNNSGMPTGRGQGGWTAPQNRKAARRLTQRLARLQRDEADELLRRYERNTPPDDDLDPLPRVD